MLRLKNAFNVIGKSDYHREAGGASALEPQNKITQLAETISEAKLFKANVARGIANPFKIGLYAARLSSEERAVARCENDEKEIIRASIERARRREQERIAEKRIAKIARGRRKKLIIVVSFLGTIAALIATTLIIVLL